MNTSIYYNKLLYWIAKSRTQIDKNVRKEIVEFVLSTQNKDGGFTDRSGKSDLYYSFFANAILQAFEKEEYRTSLKTFVNKKSVLDLNLVDRCSLAIIGKNLDFSTMWRWNQLRSLLSEIRSGNYIGETSYQLFLLLMVFDYYGFNVAFLRSVIKRFIPPANLEEEVPSSVLAANLVMNHALGRDITDLKSSLLQYFDTENAFKVFPGTLKGDLLSTAVSLVALKLAGHDLSVYAPACLQLVDDNYQEGAFLSGDGDATKDVEYTFYGLLILGVLA